MMYATPVNFTETERDEKRGSHRIGQGEGKRTDFQFHKMENSGIWLHNMRTD